MEIFWKRIWAGVAVGIPFIIGAKNDSLIISLTLFIVANLLIDYFFKLKN